MVTRPDIQGKAQQEIDHVLGMERLLNFDDRQSLPYIEVIYREVLRWKPPGLLGVPHCRAKEDDMYQGYFIPEGTTVLANIGAMARDEVLYPDAKTFKPERFLLSNGDLTDDDHILAFGFGRRPAFYTMVCVGKHVASATLWITFVSILATFKMTKAKDKNGQTIEVRDDYDDPSVIVQKKPFKYSMLPRSDARRKLIEEATEQDRVLNSI